MIKNIFKIPKIALYPGCVIKLSFLVKRLKIVIIVENS